MKILEHCCYRKYLNEWWQDYQSRVTAFNDFVDNAIKGNRVTTPPEAPEDCWTLINFGDHLFVELLEWCLNMCYTQCGSKVTVAMPVLTASTLEWLSKRKDIANLDIVTRDPIDASLASRDSVRMVSVADVHTQIATVSGRGRHFVLQNNLLQSTCPGKYITTLGLSERYYQSVQPLLDSWVRLYGKSNKA